MSVVDARLVKSLQDLTAADVVALKARERAPNPLPAFVAALERMKFDDAEGFPINLYGHCLQTATRALRDGASSQWIAAALFHDAFDEFAPDNHGAVAAEALAPYVTPEIQWVLRQHAVFQQYYMPGYGGDPNERDQYRSHPFYAATVHFCEIYDQCSFDSTYPSEPLERFIPILQEVFYPAAKSR